MADTFIQLPEDSTGKAVRSFTSGTSGPAGVEVHAQASVITGPTGNVLEIINVAPDSATYAVPVRVIRSGNTQAVDDAAGTSLLHEMVMALDTIANALALSKDPTTGRLRVVQDGAAGTQQNVIIGSGTVTTVGTLNTLAAAGSGTGPFPSVPAQIPALAAMQAPIDGLRSRITVI